MSHVNRDTLLHLVHRSTPKHDGRILFWSSRVCKACQLLITQLEVRFSYCRLVLNLWVMNFGDCTSTTTRQTTVSYTLDYCSMRRGTDFPLDVRLLSNETSDYCRIKRQTTVQLNVRLLPSQTLDYCPVKRQTVRRRITVQFEVRLLSNVTLDYCQITRQIFVQSEVRLLFNQILDNCAIRRQTSVQ